MQIEVPFDFFDLCSDLRILCYQLLIVGTATLLLPFVLFCQLSLVGIDLALGVCVGIADPLGPLHKIKLFF